MSRRTREVLRVGVLTAVLLLEITFVELWWFGDLHLDWNLAGQYGVTVGSVTRYCSADFPAGFSCEEAN